MSWQFLRVDKNGTKYWADYTCPRCGGQGGSDAWAYTGWTCYECGGTGKADKARIIKEYTPEYKAKLDARRLARAKAKAPEDNAKFFKKFGMNEEGKTWIVMGKTFEIKDQLKEAGAKFNSSLGWHFDHVVSEYDCFELSIDEIAEKNDFGVWVLFDAWWIEKILKEKRNTNAPKTGSEWIGEVGDKLEIAVKFLKYYTFETHFSYYGELNIVYKFADLNGNTVAWKTTKNLDLEPDKEYVIKGTVKELSEYRGDKQTVLTRCKILDAKEEENEVQM